jgi:hypothetical protein
MQQLRAGHRISRAQPREKPCPGRFGRSGFPLPAEFPQAPVFSVHAMQRLKYELITFPFFGDLCSKPSSHRINRCRSTCRLPLRLAETKGGIRRSAARRCRPNSDSICARCNSAHSSVRTAARICKTRWRQLEEHSGGLREMRCVGEEIRRRLGIIDEENLPRTGEAFEMFVEARFRSEPLMFSSSIFGSL